MTLLQAIEFITALFCKEGGQATRNPLTFRLFKEPRQVTTIDGNYRIIYNEGTKL